MQWGGDLSMKSVVRLGSGLLLVLLVIAGMSGETGAHMRAVHRTMHPRVTIELFGDSLALTLGFGLNEPGLPSKYGYSLRILGILGCGVANGPADTVMGENLPTPAPCNGAPPAPGTPLASQPWPVQWQAALAANHPNV